MYPYPIGINKKCEQYRYPKGTQINQTSLKVKIKILYFIWLLYCYIFISKQIPMTSYQHWCIPSRVDCTCYIRDLVFEGEGVGPKKLIVFIIIILFDISPICSCETFTPSLSIQIKNVKNLLSTFLYVLWRTQTCTKWFCNSCE